MTLRPQSLRARLTLWYTAVLAGLLGVLGVATVVLLDRGLRATVDSSLDTMAHTVAEQSRNPRLSDTLDALLGPKLAERFYQLLDPLGRPDPRLQPRGDTLPLGHEALRNAEHGVATYETLRQPGRPGADMRLLTLPVVENGRLVHLVQVALSLETVDAARARFLVVLALLAPLALGGAAAGGYWLAGRALAPIDAIVEATCRIEAEDLSRRLAVPPGDDELTRLAGVLNDMLGRLEHAFAAARRFSADAAHELRTPLTILRGELEVARRRAPEGSDATRAFGSCLEEVSRLSALVEDLLFLARADAGAVPPPADEVDLAAVVGEAIPGLTALAERAGSVLTADAPAPVPVRGSEPLLFRVVFNLAENAIAHAGAGHRVQVGVRREGGHAVLDVSDDGPGIPAAEQERIFERFYRVSPSRAGGGAGLGLAVTRSIVQVHGGGITVESVAGIGTRFRVRLPLAAA